ncbi:hypothetical protein DFH09DRAFT_1254947 [Mycena vulgaris]|nr:hypothetical protein DFH09DRAFT_1254947 [Mycena vulgaris]
MELQKGSGRGSYIYGKSVHNTRIERLWLDWTQGVGLKWYDFLMSLEHNYGLDHENPAHIWLVHYLFLDAINADAEDWVNSWKLARHPDQAGDEPVPRRYVRVRPARAGPAGAAGGRRHPGRRTYPSFGVDFETQADSRIMDHLRANNPEEADHDNPFLTDCTPQNRPHVVCDAPDAPLSAAQIALLDERLCARVDLASRDMGLRKLIWQEALAICAEIVVL